MKTILAKELRAKMEKSRDICILDVRAKEKFEKEHIKNENIETLNIPKHMIFENQPIALPDDKEIIITCTTGNSARKCAEILEEKGYAVTLLEGGMTAWKESIS
ncbi:rhodanese-like domain-containing protein [Bacillus sp. FJAT-50079]|uniref:rhodanese-like domain-containing protein n=1 Tax=Bacillus sp. FJAT-50079 TaxID=2833577 RepID=UPI001BC9E80E|nr:rhodanese-like domain-containing protein [Bacillus sp. FJAT-50079]MBS4207392.1 rhodanese-like domain-containing protein [Bacillus sp. FJAT-50079]